MLKMITLSTSGSIHPNTITRTRDSDKSRLGRNYVVVTGLHTVGKVKENPQPLILLLLCSSVLVRISWDTPAGKTVVRKRKATQGETSVNLCLLYLEMTPHPCPLGQNFFSRPDLRDVLHAPCTIYHHAAYN